MPTWGQILTVDKALANVEDAIAAVAELYEDLGRPLSLTRDHGR